MTCKKGVTDMERHIYKNGKKLRYGYTTGSCATAASKAATMMLLTGKQIKNVAIHTPKGWDLNLSVTDIRIEEHSVSCAIVKDSGDDPDITNGIKIYAKVNYNQGQVLNIYGGIGVGKVTKEGLGIEVGKSAINKTPLKMIEEAVTEIIGTGVGLDIEIYVPRGEVVAKRTFNKRLGILGGISIIGTTGIVEPMSEDAFKESLALEMSMQMIHKVDRTLLFVPGNYGLAHCKNNNIKTDNALKTSNFIGYMMEQACVNKAKKVLLVGHIGKLSKVAIGIYHTHSRVADGRFESIVAHLLRIDSSKKLMKQVLMSNTTEEAVKLIIQEKQEHVFTLMAESIQERLEAYVYEELKVEVILFSQEAGTLGMTKGANQSIKEINDD